MKTFSLLALAATAVLVMRTPSLRSALPIVAASTTPTQAVPLTIPQVLNSLPAAPVVSQPTKVGIDFWALPSAGGDVRRGIILAAQDVYDRLVPYDVRVAFQSEAAGTGTTITQERYMQLVNAGIFTGQFDVSVGGWR